MQGKRRLGSRGVKAWLTVLGCLLLGSGGWTQPKAVVQETSWDFGKVPNFGHVAHTFTIENRGDAVLKVDSIRTGCGCTTSDRETGKIPAGGRWHFQLAFNAGVLANGGTRTEQARVYTNDPRGGTLSFTLLLKVTSQGWETVEASPRVIEIDSKEGPAVTVRNKRKDPLRLSVIETSGFLSMAKPGDANVNGGDSITIRLTAAIPRGADARDFVVRLGGKPVHSSVTLVASGQGIKERFTIPSELAKTVQGKIVRVEPQ